MKPSPEHQVDTADRIDLRFDQKAAEVANNTLFVGQGGLGHAYSFKEVSRLTNELSAGLIKRHLVQTKEIGLLSENCPQWCIAYLSILKAGGTVVPIDANLKEEEIRRTVTHAKLKVIFLSESYTDLISEIDPSITLFSLNGESIENYMSLRIDGSQAPNHEENRIASLIYTSGTTGTPKTVELTHSNILSNYDGLKEAFRFGPEDKFLSVLPLHHTFEATCGFITPMLAGSSVIYARSLKSKDIIEDLRHNQITVMCGVPLLYEKMYHSIMRRINAAPVVRRLMFKILYNFSRLGWMVGLNLGRPFFKSLRKKAGLDSVDFFVSGGAAIPPKIAAFFNFIGFQFFQGYGMTECSPVIATNRLDDIVFGSVGQPIKGVEIKIDSPDSSGVGEIIVRGKNVTPGYRGNPEATAELIKDGWLYTGDLGKIKRGHLWITGRRKNLIVSSAGKNIYPEELEEKLLESTRILEAIIFGRKKETKQGEEVRAIIVPDMEQLQADCAIDPSDPDMDAVRMAIAEEIKTVNTQLSEYKRISGFDVQLDELEKTSTKKIKRFLYK